MKQSLDDKGDTSLNNSVFIIFSINKIQVFASKVQGKVKTKIKIGIILVLSMLMIIIWRNIYKQSPRYIIKDTVMWYEKDFTIPLFCKKVKFEYDKKSGNYTGKFAISEKQKDSLSDNLKEFNERSVNVTNSIDKY